MSVALEYLLVMVGHIYHPSTAEVGQDVVINKSKLFPWLCGNFEASLGYTHEERNIYKKMNDYEHKTNR